MSQRSFSELPPGPATHFRLQFYGALLRLRARLPETTERSELGFLADYFDELAAAGFGERAESEHARWRSVLDEWESHDAVGCHLPLRALRSAFGLEPLALDLLVTAGLVDEDARFGGLFEAMNGLAEPRPTVGLLATWTADDTAREALHELLATGLLETPDPRVPRSRWPLQVPVPLWDALRGGRTAAITGGVRFRAPGELPALRDLVLPSELGDAVRRAAELLGQSRPRPLVVRGPPSSGRHTIVAAIAHELGLGLLEIEEPDVALYEGPLASALHALPVVSLDPAPGEAVALPALRGYDGPRAAVAGRRGGIRAEGALTISVTIPDPDTRAIHWCAAIGDPALARELGDTVRIGSGTIRRLGSLARAEAALAGRVIPAWADVLGAQRALEADALETLATRVPVSGDWRELAVAPETAEELALLERRCRNRERLQDVVGPALAGQLTPGVRALFSGPSGTGKTLSARLLAAALGKDLYALDLATVVNKYLGETEKNLDAVFGRAEELDVVLLLDEGDALMTRRTDVSTSNDRYANLETNFLLSRLESYEGILIVTTNAGERIDPAFRRRLDVVIDFRAPDAEERRAIWEIHLAGAEQLGDVFLTEVATRCQLTGGAIRNAALHASLLALADGGEFLAEHVVTAVRREYRKVGGVCPLREAVVAHG
jgi:hypothetical protein